MKTRKVKCPKCGYAWVTKSKMKYITCPNCLLKFNSLVGTNSAVSSLEFSQDTHIPKTKEQKAKKDDDKKM